MRMSNLSSGLAVSRHVSELATREALGAVARNVTSQVALDAGLAVSLGAVSAQVAGATASIALLLASFLASLGAVVGNVANLATHKALGSRLFLATGAVAADVAGFVAHVAQAIILGAVARHVAGLGAVIACGVRPLATPRLSGWCVIAIGTVPAYVARLVANVTDPV